MARSSERLSKDWNKAENIRIQLQINEVKKITSLEAESSQSQKIKESLDDFNMIKNLEIEAQN